MFIVKHKNQIMNIETNIGNINFRGLQSYTVSPCIARGSLPWLWPLPPPSPSPPPPPPPPPSISRPCSLLVCYRFRSFCAHIQARARARARIYRVLHAKNCVLALFTTELTLSPTHPCTPEACELCLARECDARRRALCCSALDYYLVLWK